ncbi:gp53-like domain-containing protein [Escherichia coli]
MANLPETPQWEDGIYQIEVSDPVLGGPDGISNRQGKQLASRTLYLKQQVEKGGSDLEKHIAAADPHTQYAPKASPTFTGTPTAPTQAKTDNSTKLATTAHVKSVVADYAPLSSPALTGKPTAPTAAQAANDTQLANTAFVKAAIAALVASSPEALDTLNELAAALGNDPNFATTMTNALAGKQPLDNTLTALSGKSVAALLEYLGLGEAAKLGAAVGVTGNTGRILIPALIGGVEQNIIFQWVSGFLSDSTGVATVTLPMAFPNALLHATAIDSGASASSWNGSAGTTWGFDIGGSTRATVKLRVLRTTNGTSWAGASAAGCLFAIGY